MKISLDPGGDVLLGDANEYVDPRDLKAASLVRDFARAFLQEQQDKGRGVRTVERYERYLVDFCRFMEHSDTKPKARVQDIDIRVLKAYSSTLTRRTAKGGLARGRSPISPATKNLHLIALRGLLKFGVLLDLGVPGPEKVELAKAPQPSPDARHLETSRLDRLIESFDLASSDGVRGRALVELLCATGCRISEVAGLDRRKLELDRGAKTPPDGIRIVDEVTVLGKGNRHRRVYLTTRAREWLAKYLQGRKDKDPALFVTRRRKPEGYRMSVWMAQKTVSDAAKRAGLVENVSPHWLRHAAITEWTTKLGLPAAQRLAGHRDISTTNRYLGGSDKELKELYRKRIG